MVRNRAGKKGGGVRGGVLVKKIRYDLSQRGGDPACGRKWAFFAPVRKSGGGGCPSVRRVVARGPVDGRGAGVLVAGTERRRCLGSECAGVCAGGVGGWGRGRVAGRCGLMGRCPCDACQVGSSSPLVRASAVFGRWAGGESSHCVEPAGEWARQGGGAREVSQSGGGQRGQCGCGSFLPVGVSGRTGDLRVEPPGRRWGFGCRSGQLALEPEGGVGILGGGAALPGHPGAVRMMPELLL